MDGTIKEALAQAGAVREDDAAMVELLQRQGAFTQASALRAEVASLVLERDDLAKRLGCLEDRHGKLLQDRDELHRRIERQAKNFAKESEERDSYRDQLHDSEKELSSARARIEELEGQNEALSCDLIKANVRVEELEAREAELLATQADNALFMEDQKKRIASLEKVRDHSSAKVVLLMSDLVAACARIEELESGLVSAVKMRGTWYTLAQERKGKLAAFERRIEELERRDRDWAEGCSRDQEQYEMLRSEHVALQEKIAAERAALRLTGRALDGLVVYPDNGLRPELDDIRQDLGFVLAGL